MAEWAKNLTSQRPRLILAGAVLAGSFILWRSSKWIFTSSTTRPRVLAVIPARFDSSRFPGKPLVNILGKPLIQRTWEQAKLAKSVDCVVIATDDERIAECCRGFGAEVIMTSPACQNGTERCAEAVHRMKTKYNVVVNVQCDEPLMDPFIIDAVVATLRMDKNAVASTAVTDLKPENAPNPNRVKCVVDCDGYSVYFSRALIPHNRNGVPNSHYSYLLHLGLYAYDEGFLRKYLMFARSSLEEEEGLEQLRIVENGFKLKVVKVMHDGHGVDEPKDVERLESVLRRKTAV